MAIKRALTRRAVGLAAVACAWGIESDVRGIEDQSRDFCMRTSFSRLIGIASSHGGAVGGVANDAGGWLMYGIWRLFVDEEVRSFVLEGLDGFDHFRKLFLEFLNGVFADG